MMRPGRTINAAVLVASVEEVVLQHIKQSSHLTEDQHPGPSGLQAGQQLVQQHKLACKCQTTVQEQGVPSSRSSQEAAAGTCGVG